MEQFGIKVLQSISEEELILEAFTVKKMFSNGMSRGMGIFLRLEDAERVKNNISKYDVEVILKKAELEIDLIEFKIDQDTFDNELYKHYKNRFAL